MHFFFFLLSISVSIIQGSAQYQAYYYDSLHPSSVYHVPDIQNPNQENRIFFNQIYNAFTSFYTSTTTSTSTSTSTSTCTVSTTACTGRRKRFLVGEQDDTIEASPVNQVEITQAADMKSFTRTERKADPQFAFWRVDAEYPGHELQSTFVQNPFVVNDYPYVRPPLVPGNARFFVLRVTTMTVTTRTTTISSSRPTCSSASGFNAC